MMRTSETERLSRRALAMAVAPRGPRLLNESCVCVCVCVYCTCIYTHILYMYISIHVYINMYIHINIYIPRFVCRGCCVFCNIMLCMYGVLCCVCIYIGM